MRQVKWKQDTSTKQQQTDKEREIILAVAVQGMIIAQSLRQPTM